MAHLLQNKESGFHGKEMQGCRWSFLQFFGLHRRRLRSNKMLSDKKHGQQKCTGGTGLRGCYAPLKDEDSSVMDEHENTQVTNKHKGSKKNSGKAGLKSFISRKLFGKEGHKEKMLPVAPRLLRTLSIHYLESNVYVFDGESAANGDGSSYGAKFSAQNATGTNLQHNSLDGSGSDTSFPRILCRCDEHMKRKSHRSISMDGILHKVPYGQKLSGDIIVEELPRSASATYHRDGVKPYTGASAKRHLNHRFRRSHSLSESLESYSHLLDSISSSDAKRVLTSSKSTRDQSNSQVRSKDMTGLAEYLVIPEDAFASHAPDKIVVDGDVRSAVDASSCNNEVAGDSDNPVLPEEYLSEEKHDAVASTEADLCIVPLPSEVVDVSEEYTAATCDDEQVISSTEIDGYLEGHPRTCDDDLSLVQPEYIDNTKRHVTPFDDQRSEDISIAGEDAMIANDHQIQSFEGTCCVPDPNQDIEDEFNLGCEQETESPSSVLNVSFLDRTMLDGSWQKENSIHSNEAEDSVGRNDLNSSTSAKESTSSSTQENLQDLQLQAADPQKEAALAFSDHAMLDDSVGDDDLQLQAADPQKEAVLNYVKEIFSKSSFTNETLFDAWRSQNMAKLQEEGCQHSDLSFSVAAASDLAIADMSAEDFLLFDLTNEALFDMYKRYAASGRPRHSWLSSSDLLPKPVGQRAMKEVWNRVSRRLEEQPLSGVDVEGLLLSDLDKADRWWQFRGHGDEVGDKVSDFVLDQLVTELALQLAKF
ncbi:unnamed protein product [Alopecurus aequalis]